MLLQVFYHRPRISERRRSHRGTQRMSKQLKSKFDFHHHLIVLRLVRWMFRAAAKLANSIWASVRDNCRFCTAEGVSIIPLYSIKISAVNSECTECIFCFFFQRGTPHNCHFSARKPTETPSRLWTLCAKMILAKYPWAKSYLFPIHTDKWGSLEQLPVFLSVSL